jgi:hypothetical protein
MNDKRLLSQTTPYRKRGTSFENFVLHSFAAIDEADDPINVNGAVASANDVLRTRNLTFAKVADAAIKSGILKDELPHELADDAAITIANVDLLKRRHGHSIGLPGALSISVALDKLRRGVKPSQIDLAGIRNARARARLAFEMGAAA